MSARTYEARGDVCGPCGHSHRTLSAAQACADRHHAAIRRGNPSTFPTYAYSDRHVEVLSAGDGPDDLTEWERDELAHIQDEVQS